MLVIYFAELTIILQDFYEQYNANFSYTDNFNCHQCDCFCKRSNARPNGGMIVRISEIEVYPEYLAEYLEFAKEVAEESVKNEKDVVSIYPMSVIKNNAKIKILEIYRTREAYKKHIESPHFKKYKESTLHMVKSLELVDTLQICPSNFYRIFKKSN